MKSRNEKCSTPDVITVKIQCTDCKLNDANRKCLHTRYATYNSIYTLPSFLNNGQFYLTMDHARQYLHRVLSFLFLLDVSMFSFVRIFCEAEFLFFREGSFLVHRFSLCLLESLEFLNLFST